MTTPSGYLTFGIALGLFTARVGLGVASYVKSRKSMSKRLTVSKPPGLELNLNTTFLIVMQG